MQQGRRGRIVGWALIAVTWLGLIPVLLFDPPPVLILLIVVGGMVVGFTLYLLLMGLGVLPDTVLRRWRQEP